MKSWFRQHRFAIGRALMHLGRAPGSFLFNVIVVAIALALPFMGLTLLDNIRPMSAQLSVDPEISVFLKQDTPRNDAEALSIQLRGLTRDAKAKIIFVPREKALESLKHKGALGEAVDTLGENPLPDSYVIKLEGFKDAADASSVDQLAAAVQALPVVDTVQVDSAWVKRLAAMIGVLRLVLILLAATLGTVVVAVVFNTIRLQVLTQRDEIAVSKLIGATDNFIHRPFYYTGGLLGLCAGAVALGGVALSLHPLNGAIAEFARLYESEFQLNALPPAGIGILLAASAGLGLVGAVLSVQRHLSRLD
jgi:cell division transport system permease protein